MAIPVHYSHGTPAARMQWTNPNWVVRRPLSKDVTGVHNAKSSSRRIPSVGHLLETQSVECAGALSAWVSGSTVTAP